MRFFRSCLFLFIAVVNLSFAETITPVTGYVWDAAHPSPANPSFQFQAITENGATSRLTFQITPATIAQDLVLTICFDDFDTSSLKVSWQTPTATIVLSQNLNEGLNASHHRVLLIDRNFLNTPGVLLFEANRPHIPVWRVAFEWADRIEIPTVTPNPPLMIDFRSQPLSLRDITGAQPDPLDDTWSRSIITAPITTKVEKVSTAFSLSVPLQSVPRQARFHILVSGLPFDCNLMLSANGNTEIPCQAEVPDLTSAAYRENPSNTWDFAGWRKYECLIPAEDLQPNDNIFYLRATATDPNLLPTKLNIRDALLQLRFPEKQPSPPPTEPVVVTQPSTDTPSTP